MRGRQGSGRPTRREGHVGPSRREGNVVLPARRESVRIKKKMSSNSSEPKKVDKFMAKSVNPKSAKKRLTASTSGIRGGSDDGQGDDRTLHAKQDSASETGSRVVCPEKEKTKTESMDETPDKETTVKTESIDKTPDKETTVKTESIDKTPDKETTVKTESMDESPDLKETNTGIMDKSSDKETTVKTESMDESPDLKETNTGIMDKSSDKEATIKTESMDETPDMKETNTGIIDKSCDNEDTKTKTDSMDEYPYKEEAKTMTRTMDESPDKEETNTGIMDETFDDEDTKTKTESLDKSPKNEVTKTGSRVESSDKQEVTMMADVMKESATPRMNPLDKCVHGNLVYRCGICFRLIDGLDTKVSSLRRGWHMCTMCHMGFRDPVMHRSHFVNFHKIVAPPSYQCPTCGARVEDNRIKEHMKLHEDRSVSPGHPHVPGIRHKHSCKNSAKSSTSVELSKLRNQMHTGTATISAKEKSTGVTSNCIKEHLAQGEEDGSSSQDPCQNASSECKEVMPGAILCHICGDNIENIGFEEHTRMHDKEKTQVQITQLCHLCGTDVARDALEKHMDLHKNPPPTKSDISRKPTHKRKCDDDEVPVTIPKVMSRNALEREPHELPKYVPKPVPDNVAGEGCCYNKKDPAENADHRLFNKMCAWHMCDVCNMGFRGHWWYKEHLLKVHDIVKPSTSFCLMCGRKVGSEDMEMHVKAHERDETYVENDSGLVDDKRFPCSNCSKSFSTFSVFRNHIKEHNQVVLVKQVDLDFHLCSVCGSHVLGEDSLAAHASFHQAVESPNDCCTSLFRCKICSITFDSNGRFIQHMETWHLKQFNFNITNKLHFDKYAVTVYKCVCSSIFLDFLDYKRHVKKKHPDVLEERTPMEHTDIKVEGMILGEALGQKSKLMHTTTQTNHPDIDLRTPANKVFILNKQTTEMTQTCRNRRSVPGRISSDGEVHSKESHPEHQDKGASIGPCHSQHELEGVCSSESRSNYEQGRVGSIESQSEDGDRASYLVLVQLPEAGDSFGEKIQEESKRDCKSVGDDDDGMNDNKESTSSSPVEMNCTMHGMTQMCLKSETNAAGKDNAMNLVLSIPNRSEFCSATEASNIQYVVGRDSSFRVVRKQSGRSESNHGIYKQIMNHGTKGHDPEVKVGKEQVGNRHSTPDSSIVGVEPKERGGMQDIVISTSGVNVSGATSSIDPSGMKVTRCDKEGAMIKISVKGLEGYCFCTQCGRIFGNEKDFVSHCKATMTHKIKTVYRKNVSKQNQFHHHRDVSLNLCSCGKLLVGQVELNRHLQTYNGPVVVASSYSSRHLMCDCGTQTGDDARSFPGHIPSDRHLPWRNIRQFDKGVMVDQRDIKVTVALNLDPKTREKDQALCTQFDVNMANNVQYVVEQDSSFRVAQKQSRKSEGKHGQNEQLFNHGIKGNVCDLDMEDAYFRAMIDKELVGDRHSTPDSSIVGVAPVERGGGQDVVMSTSGMSVSGAASSIDPSSMKVTRCDKEGAMIKISVQGLEGHCSCTLCGRIFGNENDFISHCKVTMTHKILKTVHRKNLSKENLFHRYLSEVDKVGQGNVNMGKKQSGEDRRESICSSNTDVLKSIGGADVSLNLCSCGKLLVGQEDLDRHLQTYKGPDVVASSHSSRHLMCDCGTQSGDDARSCQGHIPSDRLRDWRNIRQIDKCVMADEQDIDVSLALNFDQLTVMKEWALCKTFDENMADNVQYVVELDSSFRIVRKQSGKLEAKYGSYEQLITCGTKEGRCDLDMQDAFCRAMIDKELVGDRHSTPDSSVVGIAPVDRVGGQDVVMSMSGVNMSGATSSIDPSMMKVTRCDKEEAMIKIAVQGLEGYCSCTLCGRIFRNENDFVSHCKVTMVHKILKSVYRKNLSKESLFNQYLSEEDDIGQRNINMENIESGEIKEGTCSSDSEMVDGTGGSDVSLNLCSCGKLLVGQEDLDRHLRTYRGPDVVGSSHKLRCLMCDCGTQTGDDARACQNHMSSSRCQDWRNIRQFDKGVMVGEQDINVTSPPVVNANIDIFVSVVGNGESDPKKIMIYKTNSTGENGPAVSNCTKEKGLSVSNSSGEKRSVSNSSGKKRRVSNSSEENGLTVSNSSGENGPGVSNSSGENGPGVSNSSGENGPGVSNSSGENGPGVSNSSGENGPGVSNSSGENGHGVSNSSGKNGLTVSNSSGKNELTVTNSSGENGPGVSNSSGENGILCDSSRGGELMPEEVKQEGSASVISGVSLSQSLLTTGDKTQQKCWSAGTSTTSSSTSSTSSTTAGMVEVHVCSLCRSVFLQKEDMLQHLSHHKSYICQCSVLFLDFASYMCHAQAKHKMAVSDKSPVLVNLLGHMPQISPTTKEEDKMIVDNFISKNFMSTESRSEETLVQGVEAKGYFTCECYEIFASESAYHQHLKQVVSKGKHGRQKVEKWHHCSICPMAFATKFDLGLHQKTEHRKKMPMQISSQSNDAKMKVEKTSAKARCGDCGINFDSVAGLQVHKLLYQGTFKCTHRQDQVRAEMLRGKLLDRGIAFSTKVDKAGAWVSKDRAMLASKSDSQAVGMDIPNTEGEVRTDSGGHKAVSAPVESNRNPGSASEVNITTKVDTCGKTSEIYVIGSDGNTVIKTEPGAGNRVVDSDSFIITRNDDHDDDDDDDIDGDDDVGDDGDYDDDGGDDDGDDDGEGDQEDVGDHGHETTTSDPGSNCGVNPSEIIAPGFGFVGSDSTEWTMMVPMVTIKKEPEEGMESLQCSHPALGGVDTEDDAVMTDVKVEPGEETEAENDQTGSCADVGGEATAMLAKGGGDSEDEELDNVQVKEEPVSDEDLSQADVGNMVYIHKSSRDIFDEHDKQQLEEGHPETKEQLVISPDSVKEKRPRYEIQPPGQQQTVTKQKSVKQQLVEKLQIIKQQKELAKLQPVKPPAVSKLRTVKQQLLAKRQLAKQQRLAGKHQPVKEEPPIEQQPEVKQQPTKQQAKKEQLFAPKRPWIKIQPKLQPMTTRLSVTNTQPLIAKHKQPLIQIQTQPLIKLQHVAQEQPVVKLQQVAQQQPVVKLQQVAQQQPVVKLKAVAQQQPVVKLKAVAQQQPVVKLQQVAQQQPVVKLQQVAQQQTFVKLKAVAQQQPVVKLQQVAQQQPVVKLQQVAQQQPFVKLKAVAQQQPVVKLQSVAQQQTGTQNLVFKLHPVTQKQGMKVQTSPQQKEVTPLQGTPSLYRCGICDKAFGTPGALIVHVKTHSKKIDELNCFRCGKVSPTLKQAFEHMNTHDACSLDRPYGCPVCKKTFQRSWHLSGHLQTHKGLLTHGNVTMCAICGSQFKQASSLRKHMHCHMRESDKGLVELVDKVDPALMPVAESYPCEKCGLVFRSKNRKAVHVRYVHKRMALNKCKQCEKTFYSPSELERHTRTHTGEKPFGCDQCGKAFALSTTLKDHLRSHTGERPFKCSICLKSYSSSSILGRHKLTHVGERKFKCDICDKSFLYSNSLTVHMRTHTGDRPFSCNICGKTFTASCHYRVHMRIHTGEKPYKCMFCERQFNNYGSHYRHIRTHPEWKSTGEQESEDIPEVLEVKQEVTSIDSCDESDLEGKLLPFMLSSALKTKLLQTKSVPDERKVEEAKQNPEAVSPSAPSTAVSDESSLVSGTDVKKTSDSKSNIARSPVKSNLCSVILKSSEPLMSGRDVRPSRQQHIHTAAVYAKVIRTQATPVSPPEVAPTSIRENLKRPFAGPTTSPGKKVKVTGKRRREEKETGPILNRSPSTSSIIAQMLQSQTDS